MSIPDRAPAHAADNPAIIFLLTVYPLMRVFNGEKKANLRRQWINLANWSASGLMGNDQRELPNGRQAAFRVLFAKCIVMAEKLGIPRIELVEAFNARSDSGVKADVGPIDETVDQIFLALLVLLIEQQKAAMANEAAPAGQAVQS